MTVKKIIFGLFIFSFLSGCAQNAALIGPAYTFASSGSVYQAGFAYGGNEIITKATGKSAVENVKEVLIPKKEDNAFQILVKRNIEETRKKLNLSNQ